MKENFAHYIGFVIMFTAILWKLNVIIALLKALQ